MIDDDQYDPMISWVIQEVIDAITNQADEKCGLTDEQWLSLYDAIQNDVDCAEHYYNEYQNELRMDAMGAYDD